MANASAGDGGRRDHPGISRGEWLTAAIGALLTLATIGYVVYEGLTEPPSPVPEIQVAVDTVIRQPRGWLVRVEARNRGEATAAAVRVSGELHDGRGIVETSEMVFEYLPEHSSREGGLIFARDPGSYTLRVRATGYERP